MHNSDSSSNTNRCNRAYKSIKIIFDTESIQAQPEQTTCMRVDNGISNTKIKRGVRVRQGCGFLPDLFNLYSQAIFKEIEDMQGIVVLWRYVDKWAVVLYFEDHKTLAIGLVKKLRESNTGYGKETALTSQAFEERHWEALM